MADLKSQVREIATALEAKKAEAAVAFADFDALRKSAVSEGVDFAKDADAFARLDDAGKKYDLVREEVASLDEKRARLIEITAEKTVENTKSAEKVAETLGAKFVTSPEFKAAVARLGGGDSLPLGTTGSVKVVDRAEMKTLFASTSGQAVMADRLGLIVPKALVGLDIFSVIAQGVTDSDTVEYLEETTYTNAAVETAETTAAAESAVAFTKRTAGVKEIAHFIPVTRRALADASYIESWVNNRLVDGVRRRMQTQILSGDGSGDNLTGIYNTSGIGSIDRSTLSLDMVESLHRAITTVRINAFAEPDFIGIHPSDWETIRLVKASGSGEYAYGAPASAAPLNLWGVPVLVHAAFTSGSPMVGIGREATLWTREGVSVAASDSHSDYFIKRQVALLATARVAFAVTQPKAFAVSVA